MAEKLTDYERYIRTEELLVLQKPKAERVNRDELIFQSVHQAAEIMMKVIIEEANEVGVLIAAAKPTEAAHYLLRMKTIIETLAQHIRILETMTPADYHVVRLQALGRGSGQESPGFNQILALGAPLWKAYQDYLIAAGLDIPTIFRAPHLHWDAWSLTDALMAFDEGFRHWRFAHIELVKRIIGMDVKSLKNVPASQLAFGLQESFFPELWAQVNVLTRETRPGY
jgi:tryptophan 2,3-dioxygenase